MRQFEDRARTALGIEAGMGRFSIHGNGKAPDALAFSLDVAFCTHRRFEHEGSFGTACQHADIGRRRPAADFLVGVNEDHRCQRWLEMQLADSA